MSGILQNPVSKSPKIEKAVANALKSAGHPRSAGEAAASVRRGTGCPARPPARRPDRRRNLEEGAGMLSPEGGGLLSPVRIFVRQCRAQERPGRDPETGSPQSPKRSRPRRAFSAAWHGGRSRRCRAHQEARAQKEHSKRNVRNRCSTAYCWELMYCSASFQCKLHSWIPRAGTIG